MYGPASFPPPTPGTEVELVHWPCSLKEREFRTGLFFAWVLGSLVEFSATHMADDWDTVVEPVLLEQLQTALEAGAFTIHPYHP